jgi:hypothetical protein
VEPVLRSRQIKMCGDEKRNLESKCHGSVPAYKAIIASRLLLSFLFRLIDVNTSLFQAYS